MADKKTCAVIGSGIAGLAAAIRMANRGYAVSVFEANEAVGGKMGQINEQGYRFDTGPSVLTMPAYIDELFLLSQKNPRDYWNYNQLDPVFNYFFNDGTVIQSFHGKEKFAEEVASKTDDDAASIIKFLEGAETKFNITNEVFMQRSLHRPLNYLSMNTLKGILNFGKIEAFTSLNDSNRHRFKDYKTVRIFNRFASYNGSNPYEAPATLGIIPHFEMNMGTYFPEGGIYKIISSLQQLAEEIGVKFKMNTGVDEIIVEGNKAKGIITNEAKIDFDVVISNMDVYNTYHQLIPSAKKPTKTLNQERSSSVIVFYWGIKRKFDELRVHNLFYSDDDSLEYQKLFKEHSIANEATVYVNVTSKKNASDAPEGCENWFVMVNAPHIAGQSWDDLIASTRSNTIDMLNKVLKTDLEPLVDYEKILEPRILEKTGHSAFGSVFGNSSNSKFSAFLRHPNFSSRIKNLFFCGGTVHPGPSIPLSLLSAKIAVEMAD
ncbi:MAG TPA: phytoene desaturase [Flavobacteriales bacterium]|nr:phytoene desaturase [Flavobacteriales bacterium]